MLREQDRQMLTSFFDVMTDLYIWTDDPCCGIDDENLTHREARKIHDLQVLTEEARELIADILGMEWDEVQEESVKHNAYAALRAYSHDPSKKPWEN